MSHEPDSTRQTEGLPDAGQEALDVLRNVWSAQNQTSADIDEACGNTKSCRNMQSVGFHGLANDVGMPATDDMSIGHDLRTAWKTKLEREGKLAPGTKSVRSLVFDSPDEKK